MVIEGFTQVKSYLRLDFPLRTQLPSRNLRNSGEIIFDFPISRRCKASLLGLMAGLRGLGGVEYGFAKANAVIRIQLPGGEFVGMLRVRTERRRSRHSPAAPERRRPERFQGEEARNAPLGG